MQAPKKDPAEAFPLKPGEATLIVEWFATANAKTRAEHLDGTGKLPLELSVIPLETFLFHARSLRDYRRKMLAQAREGKKTGKHRRQKL